MLDRVQCSCVCAEGTSWKPPILMDTCFPFLSYLYYYYYCLFIYLIFLFWKAVKYSTVH